MVVTVWAVANSPILVNRSGDVIWRGLFVAVYVAVGEYSWWRRPESRLGPIVAGAGFLYAVTSMNASGDPLVYTLGMVVWAGYVLYAIYGLFLPLTQEYAIPAKPSKRLVK